MTFCFVGEEPSQRAKKMGVKWTDGRLAAKSLFDALRANHIEPSEHRYINWFTLDTPVDDLRQIQMQGLTLVAMGNRVSAAMAAAGIAHLKIVHPAARGTIRRKEHYAKHVGEILLDVGS